MDAEHVIERAAIYQYDAGFCRWNAEQMAQEEADAKRDKFTGLVTTELSRYKNYIKAWSPKKFDDMPELPPNCSGNGLCWNLFWEKVKTNE